MKSSLSLASMLVVGLMATPSFAQTAKEGSISTTYASYGTLKPVSVGKDRLLVTFDENGLTVGQGIIDHMTWHCWGMGDYTNGVGEGRGSCVATDPGGDQIVAEFADSEKHAPDQKSWNGAAKFTTGTGKYVGISGGFTYVIHGNEFRSAAEGTYANYATNQGSYKLP
jgi:hypothetical protein